jgi:hypothetical protein
MLRQPSRPSAPRPVANNGRAVGRGVALVEVDSLRKLNDTVSTVAPSVIFEKTTS